MEAFFVLVGLGLLGMVAAAPVLAIIALGRARRLEARVDILQTELTVLRRHVEAFKTAPSSLPDVEAVAAPRPEPPPKPTPPPVPAVAPAMPAAPPPAATVPPRPVPPMTAPAPRVEARIEPRLEPSPPMPPAPPAPAAPRFDWESLLGLKGAAWLGGITLVIAGIFLAKMAYDAGFFNPTLRAAAMVLAGVGGLIWAEVSLRRGYVTTANAVSGAAIAVLYTAFYAAHAVWHLLPLGLTFLMMALVTVVAGVVAIRYDALFSALLGLLGGFATPILLSTGEDRPVSLFSYILLLNLGLMAVAAKKRWHGLVLLGLAGTFFIEAGWAAKFLAPEKLTIGLPVFLIFGLLYLLLPAIAKQEESPSLLRAGAGGIAVPFLFGLFLAGSARYTGEWPLLFGYLALLDAALIAIALLRGRTILLIGGAVATGLTLPLWAFQGLRPAALWGPTLAVIGLAALLNLPARLARRLAPQRLEEDRDAYEGAGITAAAGLGIYALILAERAAEPPWPFAVLLAALTLLLLERTGEERLRFVMPVGATGLAFLTQIWFHHGTAGPTLWRNLAVPVLLAIVLSLVAARRARAPINALEDEGGAVGATIVSVLGLMGCLTPELAADPLPLFAALAVYAVLLVVSARRRDWTPLVAAALVLSAAFAVGWQEGYFEAAGGDLAVVLSIYGVFYLAFLVLPFALAATVAPEWQERRLPWISSALAGPAFFLPLYRAVSIGWGKAYIGALPLLLAALSVAAVAGVRRRFAAAPEGTPEAGRRLGYLALFSAVALGFIAVAIPLQLHRQWITVGWALEAAAVWWLFGKLPHPGLKYFGALLFAFAGVRLLANPEVLRYEERGLPIVNWLLYTYGVPALCCLVGAVWLKRAEAARQGAPDYDFLAGDRKVLPPAAAGLGLILLFALINLEIIDFFSTSRYVELSTERQLARDLTMSLAWGLYAMALLLTGLWRKLRALRFLSLGFLLLTVAKVFLYDLSNLEGGYRILSFLGLGVALILVSLLYQRFILVQERSS
ncbi:MAG TPA: DUF2339 domain-containing protein [Thermoanaerobaculia bacterium]|nr:DUF2339 domain-containing protein [Thermoanaerobaculia bacterium]